MLACWLLLGTAALCQGAWTTFEETTNEIRTFDENTTISAIAINVTQMYYRSPKKRPKTLEDSTPRTRSKHPEFQ